MKDESLTKENTAVSFDTKATRFIKFFLRTRARKGGEKGVTHQKLDVSEVFLFSGRPKEENEFN